MKDILGKALTDYYHHTDPGILWVEFKDNPKGEMPVDHYFRSIDEMPELEWIALQQCKGKILDVGAGAGCHALALQQMGQDITALDISPLGTALMKERSIKKVIQKDFFQLNSGSYDTILLMMNGIGLCGTLDGLAAFFDKARQLLKPGGQLVFDSSDVAYLFKEKPMAGSSYYGEIFYQYEYKEEQSGWFKWLFVDRTTLADIASKKGWQTEVIAEDSKSKEHYLVRCRPV